MRRLERTLIILLVVSLLVASSVNIFSAKSKVTTTPSAPTLGYSPMTPTNGNVTVTIYFPSTAVVKQYKIGTNGTWITYSSPIILTSNAYVIARYQNSKGQWSNLGGVTVSNIDKTSPLSPTFSFSSLQLTNQNVSVTISFSSDSTVKQYKIGSSGLWTSYNSPIVLESNDTIYAKASDAVGNWTSISSYSISNIDKSEPTLPSFNISNSNYTNQDITVDIQYSNDSEYKKYRIGSSEQWNDYVSPLTISTNTTIHAKASDAAGNWTMEVSTEITNIDKETPNSPDFSASSTELTNQDVELSILYDIDSVVKQFKIGDTQAWFEYSGPIILSSNGIVSARSSDVAGNWSSEVNYVVNNIDKTPPIYPIITATSMELTSESVTVTIDYSEESSTKVYKIGASGVWAEYTGPIVLNTNDIVYAKAADSVGNWTPEIQYEINNIDHSGPTTPIIMVSTIANTYEPVKVTILFSEDSLIRQYKLGLNGIWTNYIVPIDLTGNTMVYAKASDNLGNWSEEANYSVENIIKMVVGYTVKYGTTDKSSYNSMVSNVNTLNEIITATYTVDALGNLTGTAPADQITYANNNNISTKLMVSNSFDSNIAKLLLQSPENRLNLKNNIIYLLQTNHYKGVDIDIENIPASCRDQFTTFMSEVYGALKPLGYSVSVAVQAKTYDSSTATWNYAFDYKSLAMYSDYLMIMAYDEHYPGGTPGAVASIDWVKSVVDYTLTVVPKEKIILGLAAYGYDWSSGATKAYSINGCYNLANQYGATIYFDNVTKSKYFKYTVNGVAHTVWFEDGDTIPYKLDLVNSKELKGIGIWRLGLENSNFWDAIRVKLR
ncbi:MAG: hypothetical protein CVU84_10690 [Firmicutes bacterium HGW-Firmicutes-1]|jgi:spore germination protein YaaH|nr:MAG: hypothetical protein CVU84_10690 [Firmicutes bacterium HGW-Firmicutes-1]